MRQKMTVHASKMTSAAFAAVTASPKVPATAREMFWMSVVFAEAKAFQMVIAIVTET
jgi:hypothetical protein